MTVDAAHAAQRDASFLVLITLTAFVFLHRSWSAPTQATFSASDAQPPIVSVSGRLGIYSRWCHRA